MPIFLENKFVLLFLHTTENNFGEQKEHEMKEWNIPNEYTCFVFKHSWETLNTFEPYWFSIFYI